MAAYLEYLSTLHWQDIRDRALARAGNACQVCNQTDGLSVHHRSYRHLGTWKELMDVIVMCKRCHEAFHAAGCIDEPDWQERANRQKLYLALELDKAIRQVQARYESKEWTIIRATRPDNCRTCGRAISIGDRIRYGGSGQVFCLGDCS
jgi:hypothetical protein